MMIKIKKILVANRGEIAVRIMRSCKEMGIKTVAIYSDIDSNSLHVQMADEAYLLGSAPAEESYLNSSKIIQIALATKSDAIHPGYGFLSENPSFVDLVVKNRIVFIGPSSKSIRLMGDKTAARSLAKSIHVPIVPGTVRPIESLDDAIRSAKEISYPVLLKAAGGGGGKGMRIVRSEPELASALRASQSEAKSSFADDRVYIEKYIENPRHIEIQILADIHSNVIHLGERECSIQRRHQKIIEESPSTIINQIKRESLTKAAVELTKAGGYSNAGTLEFILDQDRNFYFLEMNTRLQVEHPVTEMRTGLDIVREQINIAEGNHLSWKQDEVTFKGHSIECRIYAEDPADNFYPSTGKIVSMRPPSGLGVREDRGVQAGDEISSFYDPIIAKLVTWANTRDEAIDRMISALSTYQLYGIRNNIHFCSWILSHPDFRRGEFDTNFISRNFTPESLHDIPDEMIKVAGIAAIMNAQSVQADANAFNHASGESKWKKKIFDSYR